MKNPDQTFWKKKRILLTGHTGFKGAWLAMWLHRLGAQVVGVSLTPVTKPNLFDSARIDELIDSRISDIRDPLGMAELLREVQPEIVFHLAAQALVRPSYRDPLLTFDTNVQGTVNLLEAVRATDATKVVVAITTDKVYKNLEQPYPYRETDALGGRDPYSASKAAAEIVIASYRDSFLAERGTALSSCRAGNVIGGGDWSEDRLIPDAIRAWNASKALEIRRPEAIRPWQHVLEPLAGYLKLAERMWVDPSVADAYNFGPQTHEAATVRDVVQLARDSYGMGEVVWGDGTEGPHEAGWLALEVAKVRHVLDFYPRWSLFQAVEHTMTWFRQLREGIEARELCARDIDDFQAETDARIRR